MVPGGPKGLDPGPDLGASPVVNLGQDKAWVAMRQIVDRLAKEEQQTAKAA